MRRAGDGLQVEQRRLAVPALLLVQLLLSKDGVRSSILKRAKLTGSVVKQSMHVLFPGGYLGENFF